MPDPRNASDDFYVAKAAHEAARVARRAKAEGLREPFGDPFSGVVLVGEPPGYAAEDRALSLSLAAVGLDGLAYVTRSSGDLLREELHLTEPQALVALGSEAARAIDALHYPLARASFVDAPEGAWFPWTRAARGLRLPALAPALSDDAAKRRFWRSFLALRALRQTPQRTGAGRP